MPKPDATTEVEIDSLVDTSLESMYQVVLFNDNHNVAQFLLESLMRIFGHSESLAAKIMLEPLIMRQE